MRSEGCRLSRSAIAVAPTAVSRAVLERPGCSKMSFENSSAGREAAATIQKEGHCSVISKWGTPKTPAPSGPLTLYVGPSRDAGRLRARRDRHRAAAPALSERRRTFQTDSLSRPGPAAGARGGSRFRGLRWTALLESGRPSSAVCNLLSIPSGRVDRPVPSWVIVMIALLEAPSKLSRSCPPTCPTPSATCLLSRGVLLSASKPLGATFAEFQPRLLPPSPPGRNALPRTPDLSRWGPRFPNYNQSRCSVEKSASPLYTAT